MRSRTHNRSKCGFRIIHFIKLELEREMYNTSLELITSLKTIKEKAVHCNYEKFWNLVLNSILVDTGSEAVYSQYLVQDDVGH